jgi:beta-glucosidase
MNEIDFPKDFLWGSASSAHQVEGGNDKSQWWAFEQIPGNIKNGDKSGKACDHYNRYKQDFEMLSSLNHNAHRISIEWSRIYPDSQSNTDREAIDHYHKVLDKLLELKIEPFVTTFHFTIPQWFADMGGFEKLENIKYYIDFVRLIGEEYRDKINYWNTINEPMIYSGGAYFSGDFPPAKKDFFLWMRVIKNLIHAHAECYHTLKKVNPKCKAGLVKAMPYFLPLNEKSPIDKLSASIADLIMNKVYIEALKTGWIKFPVGMPFERIESAKGSTDFIGLNYYHRTYSTLSKPFKTTPDTDERLTRIGHTVYPEGIYKQIMRLTNELSLPVYITENGIATDDDEWRIEYIKSHLKQVHRAIKDGADVKGYFHWSNMDNFEWAEGYYPTFGLISVNREGEMDREIKNSAKVYSQIIKDNGF